MAIHDIAGILYPTEALRNCQGLPWSRLRELLLERGLESSTVALVEFFPDDVKFDYGIVVTSDALVYEFGYDYMQVEAEGNFTEWRECTGQFPPFCSTKSIEAGIKIARGENDEL